MMTLELTQTELDLISKKREEEAKAEQAKQEKTAKQIAERDEKIARIQKESLLQNQVAAAYAKEIPGSSVEFKEATDKMYCEAGSKEFIRKIAVIKVDKWTVGVAKHIVYRSKWDSKGTDNGYKMYLSGPGVDYKYEAKAIGKASTITKKITELQEAIRAKAEQNLRQVTAVDSVVSRMAMLYPDAQIVSGTDGEYVGTRRQNWVSYDTVSITMPNGVFLKYRVYPDCSLVRKQISLGTSDAWETLEKLSKI